MKFQPLDKTSYTPLYLQIADQLIHMIEVGELKPGDKIVSERELSETVNVSRSTSRLAVQELLKCGLVYRERGRGTFVAEAKIRNVPGFSSFTDSMLDLGLKPGSQILQQEVIPAEDALAQSLHLKLGDPILYLMRLRMADEKPLAVQYSHLPLKICEGLENEKLANLSLFNILRQKYNVYPKWTEALVEASSASTNEAHLLGLKPGEPVLVVRGITFTESFEIVESVRSVYSSRGFGLFIGRQRI